MPFFRRIGRSNVEAFSFGPEFLGRSNYLIRSIHGQSWAVRNLVLRRNFGVLILFLFNEVEVLSNEVEGRT